MDPVFVAAYFIKRVWLPADCSDPAVPGIGVCLGPDCDPDPGGPGRGRAGAGGDVVKGGGKSGRPGAGTAGMRLRMVVAANPGLDRPGTGRGSPPGSCFCMWRGLARC